MAKRKRRRLPRKKNGQFKRRKHARKAPRRRVKRKSSRKRRSRGFLGLF